ncbi:hypothetical protein G7Z12_22220 [Streptomyces sp. ID38640]|uniref:hypothetical protein n=1 Tax=Streptomyces sp. ID38640 TaxID=1265399 RepID=UPI00140ED2E2|nr:hypothetical protein [Streptomyces sp. ID38640]QIK04692.1 hypothetical protein G7Z12_22220 [Streptomyces sp. ID38640]
MTTRGKTLAREPDDGARTQGPGVEPRVLMTLRVSRDSGRTWSQVTQVRENENPAIRDNPGGFPLCTCPLCTGCEPRFRASPQVVS